MAKAEMDGERQSALPDSDSEQPEALKQAQQAAGPTFAQVVPEVSIRSYFRWRPLPWWVCFLSGLFLLTKLQLVTNDSPCAVLGTQSPVSMSDIKRAFRTLSMCTHPDRLRGRLKRQPSQAESRRGEIIFNRASAAKDALTKIIKESGGSKVACYQGELELALLTFFAQAGRALSSLGIGDYLTLAKDIAWNLITLESGFFNTILSLLWLAFFFRIVKQFLLYLWRMGIIRGTVAIVTTVIIGPIPTIVYFIFLPIIRLLVFAKACCEGKKSEADHKNDDVQNPDSTVQSAGSDDTASGANSSNVTYTAGLAAAKAPAKELPTRNLRQRKKKETDEEKEKKQKELLTGTTTAAEAPLPNQDQAQQILAAMPDTVWKTVAWTHREPVKARQAAATVVQFDLLLVLTKPVIPLFMLVALGQVWNGLFSSLIIGHALRRWVPQMSHEAQHLLCSFFGAVHTLLSCSPQQVEDYANRDGRKVLHLAWAWSFKDVLSVMNMTLLGATVTACAALGNEPSYAASFAAGIALRIAIAQDSFRGLSLVKSAGLWVEASLRDMNVVLDAAEEVVTYSGDGIGDCGGGPFRMLFGDGPQARWAAFFLKAWLMLMPLLATLHWLQRTLHAGKNLGKKWKMLRFVQRLILFVLGLIQCCLLGNLELNASNGALGNFWVAMLFGCVGESLLSIYDIRGQVRQIIVLVIFLFI